MSCAPRRSLRRAARDEEHALETSLTSAGIKNPSIHDALVELLGKPIAECDALCIPTASYGHPCAGPRQAWLCISGQQTGTPTVGLGLEVHGSAGAHRAAEPRRGALGPAGPRRPTSCSSRAAMRPYLCHWLRRAAWRDLLPSLPEPVWVGVSAGSMVMTPRIGDDFVDVAVRDGDRTLGIVDFSIFPHLDNPDLPVNTMAAAERGLPSCRGLRTRSTTRPPSEWSTAPSTSSPKARKLLPTRERASAVVRARVVSRRAAEGSTRRDVRPRRSTDAARRRRPRRSRSTARTTSSLLAVGDPAPGACACAARRASAVASSAEHLDHAGPALQPRPLPPKCTKRRRRLTREQRTHDGHSRRRGTAAPLANARAARRHRAKPQKSVDGSGVEPRCARPRSVTIRPRGVRCRNPSCSRYGS